MSKKRRNPAGIIIMIIGIVLAFGTIYLNDLLLPGILSDQISALGDPHIMDLSLLLMILTLLGVFMALFGGIIQVVLDE